MHMPMCNCSTLQVKQQPFCKHNNVQILHKKKLTIWVILTYCSVILLKYFFSYLYLQIAAMGDLSNVFFRALFFISIFFLFFLFHRSPTVIFMTQCCYWPIPFTESWKTGSGTAWPASTASGRIPNHGRGGKACWTLWKRYGLKMNS